MQKPDRVDIETLQHRLARLPADDLFKSWRGRASYRDRVETASASLAAQWPELSKSIDRVPFEDFEAASVVTAPVTKYNVPSAEASRLCSSLPEGARAPWLCALMLWHMSRFEAVFARSGLDPEFALHYVDHFHRIIDQIETKPGFASLESDSFMKDLWLVRGVMIPAFAQVWWPYSGLSARTVLRGGLRPSAYVFGRCGGRYPFMEGHTHDPVARAYWNEPGWREALRLAALALPALPHVRGAFGTAWFYDPAIAEVSPRIRFAQDLQVREGACRIEVGSNPAAIANATAVSAERRRRYEEGSYLPTDHAIVWARKDLIRAYGDAALLRAA